MVFHKKLFTVFATLLFSVATSTLSIADTIKPVITLKSTYYIKDYNNVSDENKIYSLIRIVQPKRNKIFAQCAAIILCSEARKANLPPLYCAAVAYTESHFDQNSGPCVGIMQVYLPSIREYIQKKQSNFSGLNPRDWRDNIRIGVRELALHKKKYHSLRATLGRYNGCGCNGKYVDRVMNTYYQLIHYSPKEWSNNLNHNHELWVHIGY